MATDLKITYERLYEYCEREGFAGYDPFDGLNSRIFQALPFRHWYTARLGLLQVVKRSPSAVRRALLVPKGLNPKGLALFALAELSRFRDSGETMHEANARDLLERMSEMQILGKTPDGHTTAGFGYNFDWQSRVFFAPRGTPAIVPTAFASQAYVEAYQVFGDEKYIERAGDICRFVLNGLNRSVDRDDEICFSYTPIDRTVIYNASLLAGECLARVGSIRGNDMYLDIAARTARFVARRQREDGAWIYGENASQGWADNFHTAYVLLSLVRIANAVPGIGRETDEVIAKGDTYWLNNFFLDDGTPKYYDNEVFPVDIHSAAAAIAVLSELRDLDPRMLPMANKVAAWTCENMLGADGSFYYQKRRSGIASTPFMRWGQAWMAYALARLIEANGQPGTPFTKNRSCAESQE